MTIGVEGLSGQRYGNIVESSVAVLLRRGKTVPSKWRSLARSEPVLAFSAATTMPARFEDRHGNADQTVLDLFAIDAVPVMLGCVNQPLDLTLLTTVRRVSRVILVREISRRTSSMDWCARRTRPDADVNAGSRIPVVTT